MIMHTVTFYLFSALLLLSSLKVVSARNPVHSVLFLILGFFNSAGLFILLSAEFLAMILVIVYVGAVAVLFLFVVMMLDMEGDSLRQGVRKYASLGLGLGLTLCVELIFLACTWASSPGVEANALSFGGGEKMAKTNAHALGEVIYTQYAYLFQVAGLILLVAMIGAIVLTLRQRPGVRRQDISRQLARRPQDTIEIVKVIPGKGA